MKSVSACRSCVGEAFHHYIKLRLGLPGRYSWLEPAQQPVAMRTASTWIGRIDLKRRPQVWRIDFSRREAKPLWHDSDYGAFPSIQQNLLPDNGALAPKPPLPETRWKVGYQPRARVNGGGRG